MKKLVYLIFIITVLLSGCEDIVEVELNSEDIGLISVEAMVNTKPENNISVIIEKSLPVSTIQQNPPVNNAIVEISDNAAIPNKIILEEIEESGVYKLPENTSYLTIPGRTYKLTITLPNGVIITGEEKLVKVEPIDTMRINLSARGGFEFLGIFINAQETPGIGNYYKWNIYKNGIFMNKPEQSTFVDDILVDGNYIFDFEIFTDFYPPDEEESKILRIGDTIFVEQLSISKSEFQFYSALNEQTFTGSPFSVPPANIPGNLSASNNKRVLGLFSVNDVTQSNKVVIDSVNYTPFISSLDF